MTLFRDLMKAIKAARKVVHENMSAASKLTGATNPFGDKTLVLDIRAEESIIETLRESSTSMAILSEERGLISNQEKPEYLVVADPVDGSANLEREIPLCSVGVSAIPYSGTMMTDDAEISIIDSFFTEETYTAVSGKGVKKNGRSVKVANPLPLGETIISYDTKKRWDDRFSDSTVRVLSSVRDMRRSASNLLDLCWVASGSLDAMVDLRDILPIVHVSGTHMVFESGGFVVDHEGDRLNLPIKLEQRMSFVAASNEKAARGILTLFQGN
ncbi:MAG: inositol monophosphatase family protein [Candidatus Thorarchaeota archaeon]|jgi:myo-inositol-1(or 4)-monophosphatase